MSDIEYLDINGLQVFKQEEDKLLSQKQDTITDLDAIRSGAAAGATAIQPADVADDMEVVPYQNQTPLTAEQLAKAERGELAILNNNLVHTKFTQDGNVIGFQTLEHMSEAGTYTPGYNVRMRRYTITLDRTTRMLNDAAGYQQGVSISDTDANFLGSGETPAADGKKIIREMNLAETQAKAISLTDIDFLFNPNKPVKGDVIYFDQEGSSFRQYRFRVIKVEGTIYTLMHINNTGMYNWNKNQTTVFDNNLSYVQYENNGVDTFCEQYYVQLPTSVKIAIMPTARVQSCYNRTLSATYDANATFNVQMVQPDQYHNAYSQYNKVTQTTLQNTKHCFILDIDDLLEYFNCATGGVIQAADIKDLFNINSTTSRYYLASANASYLEYGFDVNNTDYGLSTIELRNNCWIAPVFRLNLAKFHFVKEVN